MKQPHQDALTSKQEILEIIKQLHVKCGFLDTEHVFMLPINWLNNHEFPDVNVDIAQMFYNTYCTPKSFLAKKDFDSWDLKIHGPRKYHQSFMWTLSLMNAGPRRVLTILSFNIIYFFCEFPPC